MNEKKSKFGFIFRKKKQNLEQKSLGLKKNNFLYRKKLNSSTFIPIRIFIFGERKNFNYYLNSTNKKQQQQEK